VRPCLAILSIALAMLATACGQTDSSTEFEGEERRAAAVVEDLQEAALEGEERRICRQLLSADLARRAGDCNRVVQDALEETDQTELEVEDVRVAGDRARVRVSTGSREPETETFELVRENRSWRISGFG
jgi:hypothetical protein